LNRGLLQIDFSEVEEKTHYGGLPSIIGEVPVPGVVQVGKLAVRTETGDVIIWNELLDLLASAKEKTESDSCREQGAFERNEDRSGFHAEFYNTDKAGSCSGQVKQLSKKRHGRVERKKSSSPTSPLACLRASARSLVLPTSRILSVLRSTALRRAFSSSKESLFEKLQPVELE
jgi:hypothetical protein